ncbi:MAG TPA: hypothetical protein VHO48_03740 [Anaerolineaceae bacterium]|nr:hypothetical protein [Anaerolineaceae bacterium]
MPLAPQATTDITIVLQCGEASRFGMEKNGVTRRMKTPVLWCCRLASNRDIYGRFFFLEREDMNAERRARGGCLTIFLVVMMVVNTLVGVFYLYVGLGSLTKDTQLPLGLIILFGVFCLANFGFALAIWKWKRWGLYGFACTAVLGIISNLFVKGWQSVTASDLFGLAGVAVLAILLRPIWSEMDRFFWFERRTLTS